MKVTLSSPALKQGLELDSSDPKYQSDPKPWSAYTQDVALATQGMLVAENNALNPPEPTS